jgi:hypothetical protein
VESSGWEVVASMPRCSGGPNSSLGLLDGRTIKNNHFEIKQLNVEDRNGSLRE